MRQSLPVPAVSLYAALVVKMWPTIRRLAFVAVTYTGFSAAVFAALILFRRLLQDDEEMDSQRSTGRRMKLSCLQDPTPVSTIRVNIDHGCKTLTTKVHISAMPLSCIIFLNLFRCTSITAQEILSRLSANNLVYTVYCSVYTLHQIFCVHIMACDHVMSMTSQE